MELGQMLLSNTPPQEYDADWATDGLYMIGQVIAEYRGKDPLSGWSTLASNSGDEDFENDIFFMSSYCWCGGAAKEHEDGCPPNFLYKPNGLTITWYKHAGRGIRASMARCIESIGKVTIPDCPHMFVTPENKTKGICGRCGISFAEWHG